MSIEDRINAFVQDLVKLEAVTEAFNLYLVHRTDLEEANVDVQAQEWISLLKEVTSSAEASGTSTTASMEAALRQFVGVMASQKNAKNLRLMSTLLERAVGSNVVRAREVCDAVLNHEMLRHQNQAFWMSAFGLVRRIVGGVDYKGVREIMKTCIEKMSGLPGCRIDTSITPQLRAIRELLAYIFDRNAALLPGYFIVNEILKSYPENPSWPHWAIVPLVSSFLNSFRSTAQMVTCINRHRLRPVVEMAGRAHQVSSWKLEPNSLKFILKNTMTYDRILPYCKTITAPQEPLLRYVLRQSHCKDLVNNMLGLHNKPRNKDVSGGGQLQKYPALEEQLVKLFVEAMDEAETDPDHDEEESSGLQTLWTTLSSELIFFVLFQYIQFTTFVERLCNSLRAQRYRKGRDDLMWSLLQFVSGSVSKNVTQEFIPLLELIHVLYDDQVPVPIPDVTKPSCIRRFAATSVYVHLSNKASTENTGLQFTLPVALAKQYEYLAELASKEIDTEESLKKDYLIPLVCNTFSTNQEIFHPRMMGLFKSIGGATEQSQPCPMPGGLTASGPIEPLSMDLLDSLTVHSKMSLIHSTVTFITKQVTAKSTDILCPALVETYCRLLVYSEIESLGVKGLLNNLLPPVFKQQAWGILHTLLEIFSYRLHHIQTHFRLSMLSHLQSGLGNQQTLAKNVQLSLCIESTALRLITGK